MDPPSFHCQRFSFCRFDKVFKGQLKVKWWPYESDRFPPKSYDFSHSPTILSISPKIILVLQNLPVFYWRSQAFVNALFIAKYTSVPILQSDNQKPILAMPGFWKRLVLSCILKYNEETQQKWRCRADGNTNSTGTIFAPFLFKLHSSLGVDCHLTIK